MGGSDAVAAGEGNPNPLVPLAELTVFALSTLELASPTNSHKTIWPPVSERVKT